MKVLIFDFDGTIADTLKYGQEIANKLEISEQTVKSHVSAILRKLNANDRAHAVALVMRHG